MSESAPTRQRSAYCFTPGVWFGPADTLALSRIEEICAEREITGLAKVTIWRQGVIWFEFSGNSLESPKPGQQYSHSTPTDPLLQMLAERALFMTAHSTCMMKA